MTKNQRNMLELALVHYRVDRISQGDSRGEVDPLKESDSDAMFDQISEDVNRISEMSDEELLGHAKMLANVESEGVLGEIDFATIPTFESFAELRKYSRQHVDDGDLKVQTVLDIFVRQIKGPDLLAALDEGLEQDMADAKREGLAYWLERLRDFDEGKEVLDTVTQKPMTREEILATIEVGKETK